MKDYANPVLLFVITALFAWAMSDLTLSDSAWAQPALWLLTLCATGCLVNGALSIARGLAHRPVPGGIIWATVHLILGCCAWVYLSQDNTADRADLAKYHELLSRTPLEPYAADAEGDTLLSLAAGLGKDAAVRRLLTQHPHGEAEQPALTHAAWQAAQNGREKALRHLLAAGVSPDADIADTTLLCAAVNSGRLRTAAALVECGADVNRTDLEGNTPFLHAVINGDIATARYLREHGADTHHPNREGRTPADYAKSEKMDEIIE